MINGKYLMNLEVDPMEKDGRILVPLRAIFEELGAQIKWDESTSTVTGTKGLTTIVLRVDSADAFVNGQAKILDVPATVVENRTLVPVRFISESLGAKVEWLESSKTVNISTPEK